MPLLSSKRKVATLAALKAILDLAEDLQGMAQGVGLSVTADLHRVPRALFDQIKGEARERQTESGPFWCKDFGEVTLFCHEPPAAAAAIDDVARAGEGLRALREGARAAGVELTGRDG